MSDAAFEDLEKHIATAIEAKLEHIPRLLTAIYFLVAGAFAIGIWVTGIQMELNNHAVALREARAAQLESVASIKALELKDSADTQLLRNIIEKLDRIERKVSP